MYIYVHDVYIHCPWNHNESSLSQATWPTGTSHPPWPGEKFTSDTGLLQRWCSMPKLRRSWEGEGRAREAGRDARWGVDELLWSGLSLVSLVSMEPITALSATESARFSMYPILWGLGFSRFRPMGQSHQRQSWSTPCPSFPRSSTPLCYTNIGVCRYAFSAGTRLARDDNPSAHAEP